MSTTRARSRRAARAAADDTERTTAAAAAATIMRQQQQQQQGSARAQHLMQQRVPPPMDDGDLLDILADNPLSASPAAEERAFLSQLSTIQTQLQNTVAAVQHSADSVQANLAAMQFTALQQAQIPTLPKFKDHGLQAVAEAVVDALKGNPNASEYLQARPHRPT